MKTSRVAFAVLAVAAWMLLASGAPQAFHSGGVAECAGCHSIHEPKAGGTHLLIALDPSSTCLSCHENRNDTGPSGYHVSTYGTMAGTQLPLQRTPGGDFAWVKKSYTYAGETAGSTETEDGQTHGHNIVAVEFGYSADTENTVAPGGGTYPAANLSCTSCHDPHGTLRRLADGTISRSGGLIMASGSYNGASNEPTATSAVGVYRLLRGTATSPLGVSFPGVPAAKAPSTYNQSEATNQVRVAYGSVATTGHTSWGKWCATCHPNMDSSTHYTHVVDTNMSGTTVDNYNAYVMSGNLSGVAASSYTSLVPFAKASSVSYAGLASLAGNGTPTGPGPTSGDQVTCLSCHRAHASGMMYGLRYDVEYEFMTKAGNYVGLDNPAVTGSRAGVQTRGRYIADWTAAYYDRPATQFATYQRVLCNKCHAKD